MLGRDVAAAAAAARVDASWPGSGAADVIFVFGTRLARPAQLAAEAYLAGSAPLVVVTGGAERQADGWHEADRHAAILRERGVPDEAIVVERASTHTFDNVRLGLAALEARSVGPLTTVLAVVKRHHRRALVTLARLAPSIHTIYAVTYDAELRGDRLEREHRYLDELEAEGVDLLRPTAGGWCRTR